MDRNVTRNNIRALLLHGSVNQKKTYHYKTNLQPHLIVPRFGTCVIVKSKTNSNVTKMKNIEKTRR